MPRRVRQTRIEVDTQRGVFMISVAAELADMHPQTLRMYEQRGLIEPKRSPKGTRLYSHSDVQRLRRIQEMTVELGLNLAGVERVLELEGKLDRAQRRVDALERRAEDLRIEVARLEPLRDEVRRLEELRDATRAEIVPYAKPPGTDLEPTARPARRHRIRVDRGPSAGPPADGGGAG
jgi:MerR family transcriptional regulator/heat shock protein HspR